MYYCLSLHGSCQETLLSYYNQILNYPQQHEEAVKLAKEREIAEKEALYRARMKEEAEFLAKQEAYARAAAEPVVIDTTPRPMPPELNQTLETVTEQGEEDEPTGLYSFQSLCFIKHKQKLINE